MVRLLGFTADADPLFASGTLVNVVLVVSWSGLSPAWEVQPDERGNVD